MNQTQPQHLIGTPAIASKALPALKLVQSSQIVRRLAKALFILMLICIVLMGVAPWQQTSRGTGEVVAYVPQERQQTVKSPIKGVVARVSDTVVEGSYVERGQFIVEIQPNAANLVEQKQAQLQDLKAKLATEKTTPTPATTRWRLLRNWSRQRRQSTTRS